MNQITYNQDGTVNALYTTSDGVTHHLHLSISSAGYSKNIDGTDNTQALTTGILPCTDTGCVTTICTTFPLHGDAVAQQVHCMYRFATAQPSITLQQAAQSVIDDVTSAGSIPRIDTNGQTI